MLSHVNVGTGEDVTIRDLAETVKEVVGFTGNLVFDTSKPDGAPRKLMDVDVLTNLGWTASVGLHDGLRHSYQDFLNNQNIRCK
jgi:GDP-L-fucose synthase